MATTSPLRIALVLPVHGTAAWPVELIAEHLREAGHRAEAVAGVASAGDVDVVHCFGVDAARARATADGGSPVLVTPSTEESLSAAPFEPDALLAASASAVVRSSRDQEQVHRLGIPWSRTWVLPGAVDTETYRRVGPMARRTDRVRLITEMHGPDDGIEDVLAAISRIEDVELVVMAGTDRVVDLRDRERRVRAAASSAGVAQRLAVVAPSSDGERAWWLRSAHVAVAVPRAPRMGDFAAQAMACGSAVVATPVDGLGDLVVHGVTGLNVPVGDTVSLARAVGSLVSDGFARESQGIAAADRALSRFAWPRVTAELAGIYGRIAAERGAAPPDDPSDEAALLATDVDDAVGP